MVSSFYCLGYLNLNFHDPLRHIQRPQRTTMKEGYISLKTGVTFIRYNESGQWLAISGFIDYGFWVNKPADIVARFRVKSKIELPALSGVPFRWVPINNNLKILDSWEKAKFL